MKIEILGNTYQASNKDELEKVFNKIIAFLKEGYIINEMKIDDYSIYDKYYDILMDGLELIQDVKVDLMKKEELIDNMMATLKNYVVSNYREISNIPDKFYKGKIEEKTWTDLSEIIEAILWMEQLGSNLEGITKYKIEEEILGKISGKRDEIMEINEAMEAKDNTLIGDILNYEILPIIEKLSKFYEKGK